MQELSSHHSYKTFLSLDSKKLTDIFACYSLKNRHKFGYIMPTVSTIAGNGPQNSANRNILCDIYGQWFNGETGKNFYLRESLRETVELRIRRHIKKDQPYLFPTHSETPTKTNTRALDPINKMILLFFVFSLFNQLKEFGKYLFPLQKLNDLLHHFLLQCDLKKRGGHFYPAQIDKLKKRKIFLNLNSNFLKLNLKMIDLDAFLALLKELKGPYQPEQERELISQLFNMIRNDCSFRDTDSTLNDEDFKKLYAAMETKTALKNFLTLDKKKLDAILAYPPEQWHFYIYGYTPKSNDATQKFLSGLQKTVYRYLKKQAATHSKKRKREESEEESSSPEEHSSPPLVNDSNDLQVTDFLIYEEEDDDESLGATPLYYNLLLFPPLDTSTQNNHDRNNQHANPFAFTPSGSNKKG